MTPSDGEASFLTHINSPRVLIVRLSAAGDIIHTLPMAAALRRARSDCHIGWVVEDRFAALVEAANVADEVFILPRREWKTWSAWQRLGAWRDLIRTIREKAFHAALDVQGLTKSALIPWQANIPHRIGFIPRDGRQGRELSSWLNTTCLDSDKLHVAERNVDLLHGLGITPDACTFPTIRHEAPRVDAFLDEHDLPRGGFVVLNPGAGWAAKRWVPEHFRALATSLAKENKIVVTWGGAAENEMARIISEGLPGVTMAPDTDLRELWALLSHAQLVVGCDTGPLHMAAAAGVPTVALFGPTDATRNGPYGAPCEVVQSVCGQFPACWKKRHRDACTCMQNITVPMVEAACARMLSDA